MEGGEGGRGERAGGMELREGTELVVSAPLLASRGRLPRLLNWIGLNWNE